MVVDLESDNGDDEVHEIVGSKESDAPTGKNCLKYYLWALTSGAATLSSWNIMLNCIPNFLALWGDNLHIPIITGSNQAGSFLGSLFFTMLGNQSMNLCLWNANSLVSMVVLMVLGFIGYIIGLNGGVSAVLLPLIGFVAGLTKGTYQSMSFALSTAVKTPYSQAGIISIGNAVVGMLSFAVYLALFYIIGTEDLDRQPLVILMQALVVTALTVMANIIIGGVVQSDPVFQGKHREAVESYGILRSTTSFDSGESNMQLAIKILYATSRPGIVLSSTLLLFPNLLPYRFDNLSDLAKTVNVGIFQIGDLVLRMLPIFIPQLQLGFLMTEVVMYGRLFVVLPLVIVATRIDNDILMSLPMVTGIMVLWIATHGLTMSMTIVQCMEVDVSVKEKQWRANFMCLLIVAGATVGSYASSLF